MFTQVLRPTALSEVMNKLVWHRHLGIHTKHSWMWEFRQIDAVKWKVLMTIRLPNQFCFRFSTEPVRLCLLQCIMTALSVRITMIINRFMIFLIRLEISFDIILVH